MCPLPVSELPARGVLSRLRWVDPARRFTRSLALGRSSGSFCRQSAHQLPLLVRAVVRGPGQQRRTLTQGMEPKKDSAGGESLLRLSKQRTGLAF